MIELTPQPLTKLSFAPFGDVIATDTDGDQHASEAIRTDVEAMNDARFQRFNALAQADTDRKTIISIAQCLSPSSLPYEISMVERHPFGSQAFIPLSPCELIIVVARPGSPPAAADLVAFRSERGEGIQYHRGVWHMPLIALTQGQKFLIVDSNDERENCDEHFLNPTALLLSTISGSKNHTGRLT